MIGMDDGHRRSIGGAQRKAELLESSGEDDGERKASKREGKHEKGEEETYAVRIHQTRTQKFPLTKSDDRHLLLVLHPHAMSFRNIPPVTCIHPSLNPLDDTIGINTKKRQPNGLELSEGERVDESAVEERFWHLWSSSYTYDPHYVSSAPTWDMNM